MCGQQIETAYVSCFICVYSLSLYFLLYMTNLKIKFFMKKYVQKLSESHAIQVTINGSNPSTPSEPSYEEQMKIWTDANGLTKRGRLCRFGQE